MAADEDAEEGPTGEDLGPPTLPLGTLERPVLGGPRPSREGTTLYEALAGEPPFAGHPPLDVIWKVATEPPAPPCATSIAASRWISRQS